MIYAPDDEGDGVWRRDGLPTRRTAQSLPAATKETQTMNEPRFPKGWDQSESSS